MLGRLTNSRFEKAREQRLREHRHHERLHGRDLELKALRDAWRDVLVTRRKRQIVIVGDAGVGKRTLVRAFLEGITPGEAVVVRTSARVGTAMTPYGVIADLARDVLGLAEDAEPPEVERRLLRAMPLIYPEVAASAAASPRGPEAAASAMTAPPDEASREARTALQIFGMLLGARGETCSSTRANPAQGRARVSLNSIQSFMQSPPRLPNFW